MPHPIKSQLHDVISGKSRVRFGETIQAVIRDLEASAGTGAATQAGKHLKNQEAARLIAIAKERKCWVDDIDFERYISEGAEQRVYLNGDTSVLKLNDAIYYASWLEYFRNLLLHNFFFSDTAYDLRGFVVQDETLYAVVEQAFVKASQSTDLTKVRVFLEANGFVCIRNNDYLNEELGILLEDLHDENVLTNEGLFYFIDTVFYLTDGFWELK
jgi:hypothetical protein